MAFTKEDKEYLSLKFDPVNIKLEAIEAQVKKTNGQVQKHEKIIEDALVERATNRAEHRVNMQNIQDLQVGQKRQEEELMEYRFVRKYPKVFLIGAVIFGLSAIILFLGKLGIF